VTFASQFGIYRWKLLAMRVSIVRSTRPELAHTSWTSGVTVTVHSMCVASQHVNLKHYRLLDGVVTGLTRGTIGETIEFELKVV
jgi:hypothetical protein